MNIDKISIGKNPPEEVNVIIEIPLGGGKVKYEVDKDSGAIVVDRFMQTAMHYPCNYGFIPHTLSEDGDPIDMLVINDNSLVPGAVVACKPVGVLMMEDEEGMDEKIIGVPTNKLDASYGSINSIQDVNSFLKERINHFFEHYKKLDKNKWVKILGWEDKSQAIELINKSIERSRNQ